MMIFHVDVRFPLPETVAYFAAGCHQSLMRNELNPELTPGEKLRALVETFKPIPFKPSEALDFKSHESLLRRLGLWDFVNIEFDTNIRGDLLVQLVASYAPNFLCGYVNGIQIMVDRDDLGRALKLPMESTVASKENVVDTLESVQSVSFIQKLVSTWMVLHDNECIMPPEVLACIRLIKEGRLGMIDWAGLILTMVDNEFKASQLEKCYYTSHLQHLIKSLHEELLKEKCKADIHEVSNKRDEESSLGQDDDVEIFYMEKEEDRTEHFTNVENFKEEFEHLCKAHLEESQKGRQEVRKLEREVYMMGELLEGYKESLKVTQQAFNEYMIRCTQASELVYKEVPGSRKRTRTNEVSYD